MIENPSTEDLWHPYRDLHDIVNKKLAGRDQDVTSYVEMENSLRKYKQSFFSLLHNLPKNAKSRELLKKGMEEGINVRGLGHQVLSRELYQETTIISDMYDLNEYVALDLLCTAQIQMPYYPGLPRGLVAIILYYDGRKNLVSTLRMLIQARTGVSWFLQLPNTVQHFINTYTDQLLEHGMFNRIFQLLKTLDLTAEMEKLQKNLALGGPRHVRRVHDLFINIKFLLADCVFLWSTQCGLNKQTTISLIHHLREVKIEEEASGKLDNNNLYLLMALLNAIDLSILHTREDGEELVQMLPILSEENFIVSILKELGPEKAPWANIGLEATVTFAFSVCLSSLRLVPQGSLLQSAIDNEDEFVDRAISKGVFEFLVQRVMENDQFYGEDLIYKRMHHLLCDFIVQMYAKVKELRMKADETARTVLSYAHEGLEPPPNLPRYFEHLLYVIAKLYRKDPHKLQLMLDYWCPCDNSQTQLHYRAHPRSISLFKFIRLAGDMLPISLYVSYLTMIASLSGCQQAARNCFNMFKQTSGFNNHMTWEHFFMSFNQYYANLRQETPNNEGVYRHSRVFNKGIIPAEVNGLHAVLKLMRAVADNDDFSRLALCEHPGWAPLTVLLGLVSCAIPIPLKSDLLLCLASLCKSPETAAQMWNNLESSQILATISSAATFQPKGIQTELEEIESRLEEYPLTRALLTLLDVLTDAGIPRTLGAGPRQPGFDPYLHFILNSVFLRFKSRTYKDPNEKWEIASTCLKLFLKFLKHYEPEAADFPQSAKPNEFNSPPGFHLMLQLHTKTELFNLVLSIIHDGTKYMDSYVNYNEKNHIEECCLHALSILERCLILQDKFFNILTSSSNPVLLTSLNKLLLQINPTTGKPDHIPNIMKYLGYHYAQPRHSLTAVKIITLLTSSSVTHAHIVNNLLCSPDINKTIREGFVECLDEPLDPEDDIISVTKKSIFTLLKQCLPYNAPNLTHFLFGFNLERGISETVFQLPGVLDFPRTCIHALLMILRTNVYEKNVPDPALLEASYHMLYTLCAQQKTAEPVLRFLRGQTNFFQDNIIFAFANYNNSIYDLNSLSWLLKTLAIEIRIDCAHKHLTNLKQLTTLLVGLPSDNKDVLKTYSLVESGLDPEKDDCLITIEHLKKDNFLVKLLTQFDFKIPEVIVPQWGFFEHSSLETYLTRCETQTKPKLIDIKKLHRHLIEEITAAQGSSALGQRQAMIEEIQKILLHALNINNTRKTAASISSFVDAWRQVVQVLITFLPDEIIPIRERILLQIYLLENVSQKAVNALLLPEVANHLSSTVMLILQNMRNCNTRQEMQFKLLKDTNEPYKSIIQLNIASLTSSLQYIVEWIIISDTKAQKLRINLYGALAIFLRIINFSEARSEARIEDSLYVSRLDNTKYHTQEEDSAKNITAKLIAACGEKLIEVLCHDSTGGQEVCRMLAMTCLNLLINLSGNVNWISYMSGRGYLKHIIESILENDSELRIILDPTPVNLKPMFLYSSKMGLLSRLATTSIGAELVLEQKLLSVLAFMKVFDFHPDVSKHKRTNHDPIEMLSEPENRYLQIWEPTLNICNAILTSLGTDNQSAVVQVMYYLMSHLDVVELILRSGSPTLSLEYLRELAILTGIIARTANNDLISMLQICNVGQDNRAHLFRIQKLMLGLVPRFILHENVTRELLSDPHNTFESFQTSERLSYALAIVSNLLLYSRNIIKNHGIDHDSVGVVFQPNLNDAFVGYNASHNNMYVDHSPSLGVIVQNLINSVAYYHQEKGTLSFLQRKVKEIPELGTVDLKDYVPESNHISNINIIREVALEFLKEKLNMKKSDIDHCTFNIENSMYIVWAHLDYYMLKAIPQAKNYGMQTTNTSLNLDTTLASSAEAMWKVSTDDISNLKQGLVSIFNDSFSRQLIETAQGQSDLDMGFLEVLLRKVKRLVQFVPVK